MAQLAQDYIDQDYEHEPGKAPTAQIVTRMFGRAIGAAFAAAMSILPAPTRADEIADFYRGKRVIEKPSDDDSAG